jgi:putative salt-induced outer membrane protein YdiY
MNTLRTLLAAGAMIASASVALADDAANLNSSLVPSIGQALASADEAPVSTGFFSGWKGSIDGGLNGSDGNSRNLNVRAGLAAKKTTSDWEISFSTLWQYGNNSGNKSKSRWETTIRSDYNFGNTPWIGWALGRSEWDEFQAWNWRLTLQGGVGYRLIGKEKAASISETTSLILRAGAGGYKELGKNNREAIQPEAVFGFDFTHKFNENVSMFASADFLPSLKRFSDYRILAKAGIEVVLDKNSGMNLKLGAEDRYNSRPGTGIKKNDVDFFATIGWNF